MKRLKVVSVVGTRPELIRLSRVISALNQNFDHILVHTGQNYDYELNQIFFDDLEIKKPDYFLNSAEVSDSPSETIGNIIINIDKVYKHERPDALLVLGDTNSCLAVIPAKRRKIPIFHMEAGNRCFDFRVPEEINRKIVDHTADINLTYSDIAREYLLGEGLPPDQIIKTGSPMYEVLEYYEPQINKSDILSKLDVRCGEYFVVSAHREENVDSAEKFIKLIEALNEVGERYKLPVLISAHPRTRNRIIEKNISFHSTIKLLKPLGFFDYVCLQRNARCVLSDSGTITEESSILNFPALNIRENHERPEGMEEAAVMMVGVDSNKIIQGLDILSRQQNDLMKRNFRLVEDYNVSNVSEKVVRIILSYTDYINRKIWKKDF